MSILQKRWVNSKQDFFITVKVLSRKFRGKFLYYLKRAYFSKDIKWKGNAEALNDKDAFRVFIDKLYKKEWIVYCKPPFKSAEHVFEYLGRYTHRVAISNNRIVKVENGMVTFKWRDYKDSNKQKLMTISAEEFIRRFLMHILPRKFVKIRHYGILSTRNRNLKLKKCKRILKVVPNINRIPLANLKTSELLLMLTGRDITKCPHCDNGKMQKKDSLILRNGSPPREDNRIA